MVRKEKKGETRGYGLIYVIRHEGVDFKRPSTVFWY